MSDLLKDIRVQRTKKCFEGALLSLLLEKDYQDISTTEIAKRADYNRATFYTHYIDKDDLLEDMVQNNLEGLNQAINSPEPYHTLLSQPFSRYKNISLFTYIANHVDFFQIMLTKSKGLEFELQLKESLIDLYSAELNNYYDDINPEIYVHYVASALVGMIVYWMNNHVKYSPWYMGEQLMKITNERPQKLLLT